MYVFYTYNIALYERLGDKLTTLQLEKQEHRVVGIDGLCKYYKIGGDKLTTHQLEKLEHHVIDGIS